MRTNIVRIQKIILFIQFSPALYGRGMLCLRGHVLHITPKHLAYEDKHLAHGTRHVMSERPDLAHDKIHLAYGYKHLEYENKHLAHTKDHLIFSIQPSPSWNELCYV